MIFISNFRCGAVSIFIVGRIGLFFVFTDGDALAFKPHGRRIESHAGPRPGRVVARLPATHIAAWIDGSKFFFHSGVFYRRGPSGFVVVQAPIGGVVAGLPIGYTTIVIDGTNYYYYNGVYYQKAPSGYIVVEAPISAQPAAQSGSQVTVTAPLLNVRSGPGMQFAVIRHARQGDTLTVQGNSPGWLYVKLSDGNFGWISEIFTAPAAQQASE
jgi:hypothetical protein